MARSDQGPDDPDLRGAQAGVDAAYEGEAVADQIAPPSDRAFSSLVPAIIGGALLMHTLNANVIVTALPTMAASLHEDPVALNATISIYVLAMAIFLPVSGWAADRFGAKRVFLVAIGLYAASSVACGLATNLPQILIARGAGGAAGALMGPVGRLVLLRSTPKHHLVRAMAVLSMPLMIGPVLGPLLGGVIVTYFDWRWIFFLNVPVAILGLVLASRFIADIREEGEPAPLDWLGLLLTSIGMAAIVYGFEKLGRGDMPSWAAPAMLAGGAATLVLYAWHVRRIPFPIVDLKLFRIRTFFASIVGGNFMRMGVGAMPFLLALLLQVAFGFSPIQAGMMTFASAAGALVMRASAPPILARFGFRRTLCVNAVIVGFSIMACALLSQSMPHWLIYFILLTGGFFRALQTAALNSFAYADVDGPQLSAAATISAMAQRLAQGIGVALAATLVALLQARANTPQVTSEALLPAFLIIGAIVLVSGLFFVGLPKDAGSTLHSRPRRRAD